MVHHDRLKRCHDRHIPLWLRRLRHDLFNTPLPDLEQSGIDPDETLPYCDGFPLLGPSSLDGQGTGTKDDGKDSQWDLQMSRPTMIIVLSRPIPLIFGFPAKMLTSLCWGVKLRQRHCRCVYQGKDNTEGFPSERLCVLENAYIYRM